MSIKMLNKQDWLVQVQRDGVRKTKRGTGGEAEAQRVEAALMAELEHDQKLKEAAALLGVNRQAIGAAPAPAKRCPTVREFFQRRWTEHAKVVQNEGTRRTSKTPFNYILFYLGDKRLDELLRPHEINAFVEKMKT